ncbi:MAG: 16S rRNA (uracil(1498)-N(3))-methyltransferase [Proteobacteria bacterium]|nr:16S rRNA (uracil(1498)-N(3))-methyltransferase [Pseudomonadota bacterium]
MSIPRFYVANPLAVGIVSLPEDAAHHAARVLRLAEGDAIVLFNGEGGEYYGSITHIGKRDVTVQLDRFEESDCESPLDITLVQAVTSGERMDYAIQKAVELGVSRIVPLITERTTVKLKGERANKRLAHWKKVAVSACEQCGRNRVPEVSALTSLTEVFSEQKGAAVWMLHPLNAQPIKQQTMPDKGLTIIIGPEGGFSDAELQMARNHHCVTISLGPRILRMETAGPAVLAVLQSLWGDF